MARKDKRLYKDKDFIVCPKYEDSLKMLVKRYPNGVPDRIICKVLQISQKRLESLYKRAIMSIERILNG